MRHRSATTHAGARRPSPPGRRPPRRRGRRWTGAAGAAVCLIAAACGSDTVTAPTTGDAEIDSAIAEVVAAEDGGTLFVSTGGGVAAVDTAAGDVEWSLSPASPSPEWGTLVTTSLRGGGIGVAAETVVRAVAPADRSERWSTVVDGHLSVRQVAAGGAAAVLLPLPAPVSAGSMGIEPRERTTMVVVRADGSQQRLDLEGNLEPEAFAADASGLFVVQYTPAMAPEQYRVRWLDLAAGEVRDVTDRHGVFQEDMPGQARTQVRSPDGRRLYTYYAVPPALDQERPAYAFVHVLDLAEGWAHCLDLPAPWGLGAQQGIGMAVSPDGGDLFVTNAELGLATRADTEALSVTQTTELSPFLPSGETHAAVGPDGTLYVAADVTVRVHDRGSLGVVDEWITDDPIVGLDISPDGDELFVAHPDRVSDTAATVVDVLDTRTGDADRTLEPDVDLGIVGLGRQRVPLPYGSKECAC